MMKKLLLILLSITVIRATTEERPFFAVITHIEPGERYCEKTWAECEEAAEKIRALCNASEDTPQVFVELQNKTIEFIKHAKNICIPESNIKITSRVIRNPIVLPDTGMVIAFEYAEDSQQPAEYTKAGRELQNEIEAALTQSNTDVEVLSKLETLFQNFYGSVVLSL